MSPDFLLFIIFIALLLNVYELNKVKRSNINSILYFLYLKFKQKQFFVYYPFITIFVFGLGFYFSLIYFLYEKILFFSFFVLLMTLSEFHTYTKAFSSMKDNLNMEQFLLNFKNKADENYAFYIIMKKNLEHKTESHFMVLFASFVFEFFIVFYQVLE